MVGKDFEALLKVSDCFKFLGYCVYRTQLLIQVRGIGTISPVFLWTIFSKHPTGKIPFSLPEQSITPLADSKNSNPAAKEINETQLNHCANLQCSG